MPYVIVDKSGISDIRGQLKDLKLLEEDARILKLANEEFAITILPSSVTAEGDSNTLTINGSEYHIRGTVDVQPKETKKPYVLMVGKIEVFMKSKQLWREDLRNDIPKNWIRYGDLILFPGIYFRDPNWLKAGYHLWEEVCKALRVKRLGRLCGINPDDFRTPRVEFLYGRHTWVNVVDGHVRYTWNALFSMFCPGNATERFRISKWNCQNETVVDMYAGIGYFTIPFLLHAKAKWVHACEWNPHAVTALRKNLVLNNVPNNCFIHFGDNREVCPQNVADRVYLGLIPTCQPGIQTACKALKYHCGGFLHLHENVSSWKCSLKVDDQTGACASAESENEVETKDDFSKELPCQKCREIETKYSSILSGDLKNVFLSGNGNHFSYNQSFTIKGSEGEVCELPLEEVIWKKKQWFDHAIHLSHLVCSFLSCYHGKPWMVSVVSINRVKSYAPHIDHIVYDLHCTPITHMTLDE